MDLVGAAPRLGAAPRPASPRLAHSLTHILYNLYLYLFATHQVGSASLVMDIPWIVGSFGGGSESDGDGAVLRASRASRVGARAARLTKLIRLVRVMRAKSRLTSAFSSFFY